MTPREEAEAIVLAFHSLIVTSHTGTSAAEVYERGNGLVDALAAAIEYDDARGRGNPTHATEEAERKLTEALTALRRMGHGRED